MNSTTYLDLSIVIPVFNEEENISVLYEELKKVLSALKLSYEIIFVNDGSQDRSVDKIEYLHQLDDHVKLISLSRNFGHQAAISAGLCYARGMATIMMDGDMQHPPDVIVDLVKHWKEGYDIVYTIRKYTMQASMFKRYSARLFYWLINKMTKTRIPFGAADFRLLDHKVVKEINKFKERSLFYRGLISWIGFRQIAVPYQSPARVSGISSYSINRMIRFAIDGVTSFTSFPLRLSTFMGFIVSGLSFLYGIYAVLIGLFSDKTVAGWTSLIAVVLFIGGVQLITLGILGEYVGRIYDQVKERPVYIIHKKVGDLKEISE